MADDNEVKDESVKDNDETTEPKLNTDYYDEPEEGALERSRENKSVPDERSRDLWQSTNIATDGTGPTVEEVAPVFAQARADALANPVTADSNDDDLKNDQADSAQDAQAKADEIRNSQGYVAPTGADAGIYDDPKNEDAVPAENFSAAPQVDDGERTVADAQADEKTTTGSVYTDDTTVGNSDVNGTQVSSDDKRDELAADQASAYAPEDTNKDGQVDADEAAAATNAEAPTYGSVPGADTTNTEADPQESTPEAPTANAGDTTHDDLVSDTAGEQGGLDETSADGATPKY